MSDYYIGRQPIFDANMDLYAYELLFRDTTGASADVICGETATSRVMANTLAEVGLDNLVSGHLAFVNLTHYFITNPNLILFSPDQVVLEILEDVEIDDAIVAGIQELSDRGFTIALDDFVYRPDLDPLIEIVDMIKIDITQLDDAELTTTVEQLKTKNKTLLAEKVETIEQFEKLQQMAFDYYQGYFFAKPKIISGKKIPGNRLSLMELATKMHQPDTDIDELHQLISHDIALSVKALRFTNSAQNGLRTKVESIRHAVTLLGLSTLKNWVTLLLMAEVDDKPTELVTLALTRARMCQQLAKEAQLEEPDSYFTVGLFSILDALLDSDMETILETLPLQPAVCDALLAHRGLHGEALTCVLEMELGEETRQEFCGINVPQLNEMYVHALQWADESANTLH